MAFWHDKQNGENKNEAQNLKTELTKKPERFRFFLHTLTLGLFVAILVATAGFTSGPRMVEKILTSLASPVGIVWLALITLVYFSILLRQTWLALLGFFCWLMLTIGGNSIFSNSLARMIEAPYQNINVLELERFDAVIVLGGGTNTTLGGHAQGAGAGDRILVAAKLYHGGITSKLICTGSQPNRSTPKDLHPREEAIKILTGIGVPRESLIQLKGNNTSEEMRNIKLWIDQQNESGALAIKRLGILTSASHLPRAIRLAKSNGLEAHPIPSNFLSDHYSSSPGLVIPSGRNLDQTARITKEYLARIVGR